jgi:50S ribosomal protein L16 3-hydroxylase
MSRALLAGLSPRAFLQRHWQKRPLLARQALPAAAGLVTRGDLFRLAARDDVESRLVTRFRKRWRVANGPFTQRELARLPDRDWTLLIQGVNHVLPQARELLHNFSFIPYARLDDVMVSYAPPGGGVGPHFDSYDVFLLQLGGTRRWRVSTQDDLTLVKDAPLKLLSRFRAEREWRLDPGDMLYLPPRCAHDGIAIDHCLTASIGFRAPGSRELGERFLEYLADHLALDGIYRDPQLKATSHPARISDEWLLKSGRALDRITWSGRSVRQFLGCYLTEPKPHVFFAPPARALDRRTFARRIASRGAELDLKTLMLYRGREFFVNGFACTAGPAAAAILRRLADRWRLEPASALHPEAARWLYRWYRAGYIKVAGKITEPDSLRRK